MATLGLSMLCNGLELMVSSFSSQQQLLKNADKLLQVRNEIVIF